MIKAFMALEYLNRNIKNWDEGGIRSAVKSKTWVKGDTVSLTNTWRQR